MLKNKSCRRFFLFVFIFVAIIFLHNKGYCATLTPTDPKTNNGTDVWQHDNTWLSIRTHQEDMQNSLIGVLYGAYNNESSRLAAIQFTNRIYNALSGVGSERDFIVYPSDPKTSNYDIYQVYIFDYSTFRDVGVNEKRVGKYSFPSVPYKDGYAYRIGWTDANSWHSQVTVQYSFAQPELRSCITSMV